MNALPVQLDEVNFLLNLRKNVLGCKISTPVMPNLLFDLALNN